MRKNLFVRYRYSLILLRELVITDFRLRYQASFLGYLWSLLRPLFLFVILYTVFVHFLNIGKDIPHWPVALLLGIVLWNFFAEVTSGGLSAVTNRGGLLRKINFPKYIVIISGTMSAFINLLLNMVVIIVFMAVNKVELSWSMLWFPLIVVELFLFGLGLAFILGTINVKFRDVKYIWEIFIRGAFYASAILYPITRIADVNLVAAKLLLIINPAAQVIQDARHFFISDKIPNLHTIQDNPWLTMVPIIISIAVFIVGALYFRIRSPYFAEEI